MGVLPRFSLCVAPRVSRLVRGMSSTAFPPPVLSWWSNSQAYATVLYDNFTPEVATQHAIVRVNGNVRPAPAVTFVKKMAT